MTTTQELELQSARDYDPTAELYEYGDGSWAIVSRDRADLYEANGDKIGTVAVRHNS